MKTLTMLEFRKSAEKILRRVSRGERFILSHRGQPLARLEPLAKSQAPSPDDPLLTIGRRAVPSPKGRTPHSEIDRILYGRP
jgi:prevent-host-death family protein